MNLKETTVNALAEMVSGRISGDGGTVIKGFAPIETAQKEEISFITEDKSNKLKTTAAAAVIVPRGTSFIEGKVLIEVKDPYLASAIIHSYFLEETFSAQGIHPRAFVGEDCIIGEEVTIEPMAVLGNRVTIGERVSIGAGVVIGNDVEIGSNTELKPNVTVYNGSIIGNRVIIHSGTVVGSDGFGYAANERGEHIKRPQVGIVRIDDDVEIGANCCIDRAAYGQTWIKSGVKVDNLVQVAHNVVVGENSLLIAQVGIAGSTTLGRNVAMGGQSATTGHINLGDRVMVAARGGVHNNQPDGAVVGGAPAIPVKQWAKCCAIFNKLPELQAKVRKNIKAIEELKKLSFRDE